jgi:hypothetical protein
MAEGQDIDLDSVIDRLLEGKNLCFTNSQITFSLRFGRKAGKMRSLLRVLDNLSALLTPHFLCAFHLYR